MYVLKSCCKWPAIGWPTWRFTVAQLRAYTTHNMAQTVDEGRTQDYKGAIEALNSLQTNAAVLAAQRRSGGRNMEKSFEETWELASRLGITTEQLNTLRAIHIAGTKGKGSTCANVESILRYSGRKTGLYTSPHLIAARERIRIDGQPISEDLFAHYFWKCWHMFKSSNETLMPTYFRFLTLMAFKVFLEERVDVSVIEVGIGGRYDATNILERPAVCAVTSLGLDHTAILGKTLPEIAFQKAGIFKQGVVAFTCPQDPDAMKVLERCAGDVKTSLHKVAPLDQKCIELGIAAAPHQRINAALAIQIYRAWTASENDCLEKLETEEIEGLKAARWPGRNQLLEYKPNLTFLLDGAHTVESCTACALWVREENRKFSQTKGLKRIMIFNCSPDREPLDLLAPYAEVHAEYKFDIALFCPNTGSSKTSPDQLNYNVAQDEVKAHSIKCEKSWNKLIGDDSGMKTQTFSSVQDCVTTALSLASEFGEQNHVMILVTGSLHLVGGVLNTLDVPVS
eukprot:m.95996 g.95996  ORF g.95996 m.95996 type:complete len:511 (+) comp13524_c0_seq7:63-1595(+)